MKIPRQVTTTILLFLSQDKTFPDAAILRFSFSNFLRARLTHMWVRRPVELTQRAAKINEIQKKTLGNHSRIEKRTAVEERMSVAEG